VTNAIGYQLPETKAWESLENTISLDAKEVDAFNKNGYSILRGLLSQSQLERFREAIDKISDEELEEHRSNPIGDFEGTYEGYTKRDFGGQFVRHVMDKDEVFFDLLTCEPLISLVKDMLGPKIRMRALTARICRPGDRGVATAWHQHQRVQTNHSTPWFSEPHGIEACIYLDDVSPSNGPLSVIPGSYREFDLNPDRNADHERQVAICVKAGDAVLIHTNLWHRSTPIADNSSKRRLLILGLVPSWYRLSPYGTKPAFPKTDLLLNDPTTPAELRMLLGKGGYT
jgi:ectoine hydroxylase-related dioxygenase (phytanoyl-CoA dioxygenase family)